MPLLSISMPITQALKLIRCRHEYNNTMGYFVEVTRGLKHAICTWIKYWSKTALRFPAERRWRCPATAGALLALTYIMSWSLIIRLWIRWRSEPQPQRIINLNNTLLLMPEPGSNIRTNNRAALRLRLRGVIFYHPALHYYIDDLHDHGKEERDLFSDNMDILHKECISRQILMFGRMYAEGHPLGVSLPSYDTLFLCLRSQINL